MTAIEEDLEHLAALQLIRPGPAGGEAMYLFEHALVQNAVYASLLRADRKRLHWAVGRALEQLYPTQLSELAPILAWHFDQAGQLVRALHYHTLAADSAARRYAHAETILHYRAALACGAPHLARGPQVIHLYTALGRTLELSGQHAAALTAYDELAALGRHRAEPTLELAALLAAAPLYSTPTPVFDPERGRAICRQALILATTLGDQPAQARILWNLLLLHGATGQAAAAVAFGEQALTLARQLDLAEVTALTLSDLAIYGYRRAGQFLQSRQALTEAQQLWQRLGNVPMRADTLTNLAAAAYWAGNLERALALATEAYATNRAIHNQWGQAFSCWALGMVYLERAEPEAALRVLHEAISLGQAGRIVSVQVMGHVFAMLTYAFAGAGAAARRHAAQALELVTAALPLWGRQVLVAITLLYLELGDREQAQAACEQAATMPDGGFLFFVVPLWLVQGPLSRPTGADPPAARALDEGIAFLREQGLRVYLPRALYYRAQIAQAAGQPQTARALLDEARATAEAIGSRQALRPILAALAADSAAAW